MMSAELPLHDMEPPPSGCMHKCIARFFPSLLSRKWRMLYLIYLAIIADGLATNVIIPFAPEYVSEQLGAPISMNGFYAGLLVGLFSLAVAFSAPVLGYLADRYGRKPLLIVSLGCTSVFTLIMFYTSSLGLAITMRLLSGLTDATQGVSYAVIGDLTQGADRSIAFAYSSAAFQIARILSSIIGGYTADIDFNLFGQSDNDFLLSASICSGFCIMSLVFLIGFLDESLPRLAPVQLQNPSAPPFSSPSTTGSKRPPIRQEQEESMRTELSVELGSLPVVRRGGFIEATDDFPEDHEPGPGPGPGPAVVDEFSEHKSTSSLPAPTMLSVSSSPPSTDSPRPLMYTSDSSLLVPISPLHSSAQTASGNIVPSLQTSASVTMLSAVSNSPLRSLAQPPAFGSVLSPIYPMKVPHVRSQSSGNTPVTVSHPRSSPSRTHLHSASAAAPLTIDTITILQLDSPRRFHCCPHSWRNSPFWDSFRFMYQDKVLFRCILAYACVNFLNGASLVLLPLLAVDTVANHGLGMSAAQSSLILVLFAAWATLFQLMCFKRLTARLHLKTCNMLGMLAAGFGTILIPIAGYDPHNDWYTGDGAGPSKPTWSIFVIVVSMIIFATGFMLCASILNTMIANRTPSSHQGAVQGGSRALASLFRAFGPFACGALYTVMSNVQFPLISFLVVGLGYFMCLIITRPISALSVEKQK